MYKDDPDVISQNHSPLTTSVSMTGIEARFVGSTGHGVELFGTPDEFSGSRHAIIASHSRSSEDENDDEDEDITPPTGLSMWTVVLLNLSYMGLNMLVLILSVERKSLTSKIYMSINFYFSSRSFSKSRPQLVLFPVTAS
ncbi:unnamed protein product [Protopolystoma xenopodis]|uniref:Uncharacterized protein n=1 Tax=Protopolystoma xenopodis TaxID=117903 RepID=A0A448XRF2_9PLAT|nr:unnamed protein product [Protopolystoma xenopodis]